VGLLKQGLRNGSRNRCQVIKANNNQKMWGFTKVKPLFLCVIACGLYEQRLSLYAEYGGARVPVLFFYPLVCG
jgi:hypothetical protein